MKHWTANENIVGHTGRSELIQVTDQGLKRINQVSCASWVTKNYILYKHFLNTKWNGSLSNTMFLIAYE